MTQRSLFDDTPRLPVQRPGSRRTDPTTSEAAAEAIKPKLGKIQRLVLDVYREHGPMTARDAERRPEFGDYGFSTIRKRISELAAEGVLVSVGVDHGKRTPAIVYAVAGDERS